MPYRRGVPGAPGTYHHAKKRYLDALATLCVVLFVLIVVGGFLAIQQIPACSTDKRMFICSETHQ